MEVIMRIRRLAVTVIFLPFAFLLGTGDGGVVLASSPGQWVSIGPSRVHAPSIQGYGAYDAVGRLTTIAIHPTNPQIIYVGSPGELGQEGCGIWKTTDGGTTWTPIGDSLPTLAVAAITLDPTNPDRVYIATADKGVFRSDDAGQTWINLSAPLKVRTNTRDGDRTALLINPANPSVLYLSTDDGVLRSTDGGQSWPASLDVGYATSLVMDPQNPDVLYAGILGQGVYKTVDGGILGDASWQLQNQSPLPTPVGNGPLLAISHPAGEANETVYALYPKSTAAGTEWDLFRTTDGTSWGSGTLFVCAPGNVGCGFFTVLAADPANKNLVYLGGPLLFISEIGVTPFTYVPLSYNDRQPASPHGDYWELTFDPTNSKFVYAGSDGGIFRSSDHGKEGSWSFIGDGITNVEMYDLAQAATDPNLLIAGTQDNGNILYSGSPVWDHILPENKDVFGGDGAAVAVDPTDASTFYAMGQLQDSLSQSLDGGGSFVDFHNGLPAAPKQNVPGTVCAVYNSTFHFQVHPLVPTTLLASCISLWRTTTNIASGNWISIFPAPAGAGNITRSAIDGGSDLYYVGTDHGHLFAVPSDGMGWQDVFTHPDSTQVSDIEVDPVHPDTGYVSFAPHYTVNRNCAATAGQDRIYQVTQISPVPNLAYSFTDITGNLRPLGLCVNAVAIDPHIPRTLYAATNRGVYRGRSNPTGGPWVWEAYNHGMPIADVRDLEVHPVTGDIDAATYGRSAFELVPETILPIEIDIKPGTSENPINTKSRGKIPVAILSSVTFDAPNEVNKTSLHFGRTGGEASLAFCNMDAEDVNGDGFLDLMCHFYTSSTGFQVGDTDGVLEGLTVDGTPIEARDSVRVLK
jgi:Sortilin, neurotensin receptor 3,